MPFEKKLQAVLYAPVESSYLVPPFSFMHGAQSQGVSSPAVARFLLGVLALSRERQVRRVEDDAGGAVCTGAGRGEAGGGKSGEEDGGGGAHLDNVGGLVDWRKWG